MASRIPYNLDTSELTDQQIHLLEHLPDLFLSEKDQVDFHFMMHMRMKLRSPDFMAEFERELLKRQFSSYKEALYPFDEDSYRQSFIPLPTHDLHDCSASEFQRLINDPGTVPILAKGLIAQSPAVKTWSHEFLADEFGDVEIQALDYYSKQFNTFKKMPLRDILSSQMEDRGKQRYYVNNSAEIFNDHPHLVAEAGAAGVEELFRGHSVNTFCQLFVGNLDTWGTGWHQGNDLSCALMITGTKRWYFMDPRLSYILTPAMNGANGIISPLEARFDLDYHKIHHPLYAYAPKFYCDMEPGDVLFFTKYWPHAVFNTADRQIMVNMRMTEIDLDSMVKGTAAKSLLPVYENILDSDPDFIKFKFEVFKNLGKADKKIGDKQYFSAMAKSTGDR